MEQNSLSVLCRGLRDECRNLYGVRLVCSIDERVHMARTKVQNALPVIMSIAGVADHNDNLIQLLARWDRNRFLLICQCPAHPPSPMTVCVC